MAEPITLRNIRDAYVDETRPNRNFVDTARIKLSNASGSSSRKQAFMFWGKPMPDDVNMLPSVFRMWNSVAMTGTVTVTLERVIEKWAASRVTWGGTGQSPGRPAVSGTPITIQKANAPKDTMWEFPITALLQTVANGGIWYGIKITVSGATEQSFYSAQAEQAEFRPQVVMQWSDRPEAPDELSPAGGRVVPVPKFLASYNFVDNSGDVDLTYHQLQLASTQTGFGSPTWDSGKLQTSEPEMDLAVVATSWAGLTSGGSIWWRVKVWDGAGLDSAWSDPVQVVYVPKGAIITPSIGTKEIARQYLSDPTMVRGTPWAVGNATKSLETVGEASVVRATRSSTGGSPYINQAADLTSVVPYTYKLSARTIQAGGGTAGVELRWINSSGTQLRADRIANVPSGPNFSYYEGTLTPPAGTVRVTAIIFATVYATGDIIDLDTFSLHSGVTTLPGGGAEVVPFDGAMAIADDPGPYNISWVGTPDTQAAYSRVTVNYVEDTSPPIVWSLGGGRTQTAYRASIQDVLSFDEYEFDTGKVTGTTNSIDTTKVVDDVDTQYRLFINLWDDQPRQKNGDHGVPTRLVKNFIYLPDGSTDRPTNVTAYPAAPFPWVWIEFDRPTPPDSFTVMRGRKVVENKIDPGRIWKSGTTYRYQDRTPPSRKTHSYTVIATVNRRDSNQSEPTTVKTQPVGTWLMNPDTSSPIVMVKSGSQPMPIVEPESLTVQEVHHPLGGGDPVLITQYISAFEGSVEAVLSDEIVPNLTADVMLSRFKAWKRNPGVELSMFMVNEVIQIVPYNMKYRPRAKGGTVLYDIAFDFFVVRGR